MLSDGDTGGILGVFEHGGRVYRTVLSVAEQWVEQLYKDVLGSLGLPPAKRYETFRHHKIALIVRLPTASRCTAYAPCPPIAIVGKHRVDDDVFGECQKTNRCTYVVIPLPYIPSSDYRLPMRRSNTATLEDLEQADVRVVVSSTVTRALSRTRRVRQEKWSLRGLSYR